MSQDGPSLTVRPARRTDGDRVSDLLYESAGGMYDRFAGGSDRAKEVLRRAFSEPGNNASVDVISVAEIDGEVAAALASFPVEETPGRASRFLHIALRTLPLWRWPGALRLYWAGARAAPSPPAGALYVDALATGDESRRRGAATALLDAAEARARRLGLSAVALDTSLDNKAARALYLGAGYEEVAYRPAGRRMPGFVALVKDLR